ncbi:MAG TPA: hypothetical protein VE010_24840 [Thermoanaerobaculia bacterium]|nr:hypothetical protein [Thermoanaerobaculia bacterium]
MTIALGGFVAPLHMLMMIGSVLAITHLLRRKGDLAGLIGGALTLMGWGVSLRILALRQVGHVIENGVEGVPADVLGRVFSSAPVVFFSLIPIGLLFPIGMIILGLTLFFARPVNRWLGLTLALGGLLFPLGRAIGALWAFAACDLLLALTFAILGQQILARPELWSETERASDTEVTLEPVSVSV